MQNNFFVIKNHLPEGVLFYNHAVQNHVEVKNGICN